VPLVDPSPVITTATGDRRHASATVETDAGSEIEDPTTAAIDRHSRLVGTIVHRLFRRSFGGPLTIAAAAAVVPQLVGWEELVDVVDVGELARQAAEVVIAIRSQPEVAALLASGASFHEVPFSHRSSARPDERMRGAIDCLVLSDDGRATILEFKTGRPRPDHGRQAAIYADAARNALPDCTVDVKIIYPTAN